MSDYFDRIERQLVARVPAGAPRLRLEWLAPAVGVLVVIAVLVAFLGVRHDGGSTSTVAARPGRSIFEVPVGSHATAGRLADAARLLSERLHAALPKAHAVVRVSGDRLAITVTPRRPGIRAEIAALSVPGRLGFYDWEADALMPNGKTVASQLGAGDATAIAISQGSERAGAGVGQLGATSLHGAVQLAASIKHPPVGSFNLRRRPKTYRFVARGRVTVPRGVIVVAATQGSGYFTLLDHAALTGRDVTHPRGARDTAGEPDVTFGFTSRGASAFRTLTAAITHRGAVDSSLGHNLFQHFAIVLDGRLLTVPFIDSTQYPDGLSGSAGTELTGNFTAARARELAAIIRYGPLPLQLAQR